MSYMTAPLLTGIEDGYDREPMRIDVRVSQDEIDGIDGICIERYSLTPRVDGLYDMTILTPEATDALIAALQEARRVWDE